MPLPARLGGLFMLGVVASSLPSVVQAAAGDTSWLCWMTASAPPVIRCSLEISSQSGSLAMDEAEADDMLELLQDRFHQGATVQELERLYQGYGSPAVARQIMTIPLFNIPLDTSWREQRPQQLLQALLCNKGQRCKIRLRTPHN